MADNLFDDLPTPPSNSPYARPLGHCRVPADVPPNPTVPEEAKPRLNRQCEAILERLRRGRASNDELSRISRKYTSRTSDIRAAGYDLRCVSQDHKTGVCWYGLFENGVEVGANFTN